MGKQHLYIVHGTGADNVGLVGTIAAPIAKVNANIVDLRQDVLHGLFTLFMVVDLGAATVGIEEFRTIIKKIAGDTGLALTVDAYAPVARAPDKKNLLMVCIGKDKAGIIAAMSEMVGRYNVNIEFARTIGREDVFLMELLCDISHCVIPVNNLMNTLRQNMSVLGIQTLFQTEDVFNKKKRIILFNITSSFISETVREELLLQTGIPQAALTALYPKADRTTALRNAIKGLADFPLDALDTVLKGVTVTPGSAELLQTLKIMGYKIVLASSALSLITDHLKKKLDLDYAFGTPVSVDHDGRTIAGEQQREGDAGRDVRRIIDQVACEESVDASDVSVINDEGCLRTPGIRVCLGIEAVLDCYNKRVLSRDSLLGLLGAFGVPS